MASAIPLTQRTVRIRAVLAHVVHRAHLRRTVAIALVVGTLLTLVNQGDTVLAGRATVGTALKVVANYMTPLVVSNLGLLSGLPTPGPTPDAGGR